MSRRRRKRRNRYQDVTTVGKSQIVPRKPNESFLDRHERRKNTNLNFESAVKSWCNQRIVRFLVKNEGHHWLFRRNDTMVDWWPSTAKLVINQQWRKGKHVHDYQQLLTILEETFPEVNILQGDCVYCGQPITGEYKFFGDEPLHPHCYSELGEFLYQDEVFDDYYAG